MRDALSVEQLRLEKLLFYSRASVWSWLFVQSVQIIMTYLSIYLMINRKRPYSIYCQQSFYPCATPFFFFSFGLVAWSSH